MYRSQMKKKLEKRENKENKFIQREKDKINLDIMGIEIN